MKKKEIDDIKNQVQKLMRVIEDKDRLIENLKERNINLVVKLNTAVSNLTGVLNDIVK